MVAKRYIPFRHRAWTPDSGLRTSSEPWTPDTPRSPEFILRTPYLHRTKGDSHFRKPDTGDLGIRIAETRVRLSESNVRYPVFGNRSSISEARIQFSEACMFVLCTDTEVHSDIVSGPRTPGSALRVNHGLRRPGHHPRCLESVVHSNSIFAQNYRR